MYDMETSCDTTDVKPEMKLLANFVKSVLTNCRDGIGNPLLDLR